MESVSEVLSFISPNGGSWCALESRQPETILLVEDEAFVREVTTEVLKSAGYRLLSASDATQALELFGKCRQPIDLLLADIILPGMSGRELARKFESLSPVSRVLLMSGHVEQLAEARFPGAEACLPKPFNMPALLRKVRQVLDADPFAESEKIIPSNSSQLGVCAPLLR